MVLFWGLFDQATGPLSWLTLRGRCRATRFGILAPGPGALGIWRVWSMTFGPEYLVRDLPKRRSPAQNTRTLVAIVVVGSLLMAGTYWGLAWDSAKQFLGTAAAGGLTAISLLVWALYLSGISGSSRVRWQAALMVLTILGIGLVRLKGCDGNNHPVFEWRWTRPPELAVPPVTRAQLIDLTVTSPQDWPQFMGVQRDGEAVADRLATNWEVQPPREVWRQPIGGGWSSFAVVGDYAITLEQRGDDEAVVCYKSMSGDVCWTHTDREAYRSVIGGDGPRATPTVHLGLVYTLGALGRLNCLDGATGKARWTRALLDADAPDYAERFPEWGKSCSPLVMGDAVIVSTGWGPDRSLEAYHRLTGEPLWRGGDARSAYDPPVLMTLDGVAQLVVINRTTVDAHDPATGKLLWSHDWPGNEPKVAQPMAVGENRLLIAAGYGVGAQLLQVKQPQSPGASPWDITTVWNSRHLKPKFTNVLVRGSHAYALDDGSALVAVDLATGKRTARGGRYGHGQVIGAGRWLLVQAESGDVALVDASLDAIKELTRFAALESKTWNIPTLCGRYLWVRNDLEAACYELPIEP